MRAIKLFTGSDNASHVLEGSLALGPSADVVSAHFAESPPHSAFDWHDAPETQYVVTLAGTLEFTTRDGETFVIRPGDVLVAADTAGSGHKWRLIDDDPWRRCYVVLKPGAKDLFVAEGEGTRPLTQPLPLT
jgi:quercetin dioxygenase-like cupin family protein